MQNFFPLTVKLLVNGKTHSCAKHITTQNLKIRILTVTEGPVGLQLASEHGDSSLI